MKYHKKNNQVLYQYMQLNIDLIHYIQNFHKHYKKIMQINKMNKIYKKLLKLKIDWQNIKFLFKLIHYQQV